MFSCEFCELFKNTYFVEDLQATGSETPVRGFLTSCTAISLRIFWNFWGNFFAEHPLATTSHIMFFPFFQISEVWSLKSIYLLEQWFRKLGEGVHKPIESDVVVEIRCKFHFKLWHICTNLGTGSERKGRTKKLVKVG